MVGVTDRDTALRQWFSEGPPVDDREQARVLDALRRALVPDAVGSEPPQPGLRIGRYLCVSTVGHGGMGTVVLAYDPKLQREVAIKLVDRGKFTDDIQSRMVREARMMARLNHPNVVAVHDVEVLPESGVVVVMEYVEGQTLAAWMRESHPWADVVRAFVEAGRGLAAAHAAGLLHRDFKPSNVLVGVDGRIRVTDFGLARTQGWQPSLDDEMGATGGSSEDTPQAHLTESGTVLGTPAFMPPEQAIGGELTPAADQYAFCVSLWAALTGSLPFSGKSMRAAKEKGPPAWPGADVPSRIVDALERGLSPTPQDRWPSMQSLLDALSVDPIRRRRTLLVALGGVVVLGVAGASIQSWASARAERCTGAERLIAEAWDDARRDEVKTAMWDTGVPYAEVAWIRTERELDRYASDWTAMHTEACEAATVRREQSSEVMDLRMACLHRARVELLAVTGVLARADVRVMKKSGDVTAGLPPLERCEDVDALRADVAPPLAEEAETVEQVRALLAEAKAERGAGRYAVAQERVDKAKELQSDLSFGPLVSEVALSEGRVLDSRGKYEAAEAALREALRHASRWRQWGEMQASATKLMSVIGYKQKRAEEGLRFLEVAEGLAEGKPARQANVRQNLARILFVQGKYAEAESEQREVVVAYERAVGSNHPAVLAARSNLATVLDAAGKYAQAEAEYRLAIALEQELLGPSHPSVALSRGNLATVLQSQSKHAEAEAEFQRALPMLVKSFGLEHPHIAATRSNIAGTLQAQGKYAEAEAEYRVAVALFERALGPEHRSVVAARSNLANAFSLQGKFAEAEAEHRRAVEMLEKISGPEHPDVAMALSNLGGVLSSQHRDAEAEVVLRQALALRESALGAEHPDVAQAVSNLATTLHSQGNYPEAERELRRATHLMEAALGEDHPNVARTRATLAELLLERNKNAESLPLAQRSWTRLQRDDVAPDLRAYSGFVLAKVLWATNSGAEARERARELAVAALGLYADGGEGFVDEAAGVRGWLRTHAVR